MTKFKRVISPFSVVIVTKVLITNKITANSQTMLLKPCKFEWTVPDTESIKTASERTSEVINKK